MLSSYSEQFECVPLCILSTLHPFFGFLALLSRHMSYSKTTLHVIEAFSIGVLFKVRFDQQAFRTLQIYVGTIKSSAKYKNKYILQRPSPQNTHVNT